MLVGASCDFLTPIGHENNLIVMEPGGYRFSDYSRLGAGMSALAVLTAAVVLSLQDGRRAQGRRCGVRARMSGEA